MAGNGPAQKSPDRRARTNSPGGLVQLPAEGRKGRVPAWPLGADVELDTKIELIKLEIKDIDNEIDWEGTSRRRAALRRSRDRKLKRQRELEAMRRAAGRAEREIWKSLWKTPQATQWEKRGWSRDVALFARIQAKAEAGSLKDTVEARLRAKDIGLGDAGLKAMGWQIAPSLSTGTAGRTAAAKPKPAGGARARRGHLQGLPSIQGK